MNLQETQELLTLARDKSPEARNRLTGRLLGIFTDSEASRDVAERGLMFDILQSVLADMETPTRQQLSNVLADAPDTPRNLARTLANEPVPVATPILQQNPALKDDDLLDIIANHARDHALAIAGRQGVSAPVSDELAMSGDEGILRELLDNASADIAELTMTFLVEEAVSMEGIQASLAKRSDLGAAQALRLSGHVSEAVKQHLTNAWQLHPDDMARLSGTTDSSKVSLVEKLKDYWQAADDLVEGLHRHGTLSPTLVAATLRSGHVALFLAQLRHMSGLEQRLIQRVLTEPYGMGFAVLAKGTGFGRADFKDMFLQVARGRLLPPDAVSAEMDKALEAWDLLEEETVAAILEGWRKGNGYLRSLKQHDLTT